MFLSDAPQFPVSRILVVDDIADNRDLLQLLLESEGYRVETAPEGYTAIAKIKRHPPDLIVLNLMMPDKFDRSRSSSNPRTRPKLVGRITRRSIR